jgi:hypothetical protein
MTHEIDHLPPFADPDREREWLAQESALRRERLHLDPAGDDARAQRYRLLARALRTAPTDGLPADFAQQMNARVTAAARAANPPMTLESFLLVGLAGVLLLAAVIVTVKHGAWWPSFAAALPASAATPWLLPLSACLALSWAFGAWQKGSAKT